MGKELTPLERLQLLVPGYRGYKAKDLIRQDDFLIRTSVKSKLENALNKLAELEGRLVSVSPFNPQLKRIEFVASKIRTLISELVSAQGGGADVYARYKISTEQLDEIVKNDLNMIQLADQAYQLALSGNVDQLESVLDWIRQIIIQRQGLFFPQEYR
ncbi:MAG: hypothetical protein RXS23_10105 [Metallosphaera yellowstonensis]|jgi:hypothetical protein|uniref:Uncharacterized protein n=1 Tax=Metallosphaera yellowstonensis MK1 TaxID=671065 RepID=H2C2Q3_9CREN|nr:hypothetical protein [Metallosphaera yellowstonensis]EHP70524.1 hypothetical protein MetMK1DRAFT_00010270 [Metallosphaera yellowstonensis MK1]